MRQGRCKAGQDSQYSQVYYLSDEQSDRGVVAVIKEGPNGGSLHFHLLVFTRTFVALVEEDLQRDTSKEEQRRDQEDESGCILSADHKAEQSDQLDGQKHRGKIHGQNQDEWIARLAFLLACCLEFR